MKTKKHKLILLAMMIFVFASCKKNYTCQCLQTVTVPAYTFNGQYHPEQITTNTITNTFKSKPKEAESGCNMGESIRSYSSPYVAQGQGPTVEIVTCELK
jgi:hypothetical protein